MKTHEQWLAEVIRLANNHVTNGGRPYAGLLVRDGEVIGQGVNEVQAILDPSAHGEMQAIRDACLRLETTNLAGAVMYTNGEPCPMCVAAAYWAGVETIYYACSSQEAAPYMPASPMTQFIADMATSPEDRHLPFVQMTVTGHLEPFQRWQQRQRDGA